MKLLSVFANFLIKKFDIAIHENSYRHLMLIVSLIATIIGFVGFSIKSYTTHSIYLFYVLGVSALLNIINFTFLVKSKKFNISSYFFIVTVLLTLSYLVFDSGRGGYGYLWFFMVPIVNISILGARKGTVFSLAFVLFLSVMFLLPEYTINSEYYPELKPRLILSLLSITIILFFREWAIELFKKSKEEEDEANAYRIEYNKQAAAKLSKQVRFVANEILTSIIKIKKEEHNPQLFKSVNTINDSALNIINIVNSAVDLSDINLDDEDEGQTYNLFSLIESINNLFNSYDVKFNIQYDAELPVLLNANQLKVKQVLYNIIDSFIGNLGGHKHIDIRVSKSMETDDLIEIEYQLISLFQEDLSVEILKQNCELNNIYTTEDEAIEFEKIGLETIIPLVSAMGGNYSLKKDKNYISVCFSQKVHKTDSFISSTEGDNKQLIFDLNKKQDLSTKKLNKMGVLLMEDNPITQKSILFALNKMVKYLDIAENGKKGLDLFYSKKYDLILLDMEMPIIDGYEVAEKIRKIELGTNIRIPIVAVISVNSRKDIDKILDSGVDEYIEKPLRANDLLKIINKILLDHK